MSLGGRGDGQYGEGEPGRWVRLRKLRRRMWGSCGIERVLRARSCACRSGAVARSAGDVTHIPIAAMAAMKVCTLDGVLHSVGDVCRLLKEMDLEKYCGVFRENHVDFKVFQSLSNEDLKTSLQVHCLADRRLILDAIAYFEETASRETAQIVPEHGRLLTHLDNTRNVVAWFRLSLWLLQLAVYILAIRPSLCNRDLKAGTAFAAVMLSLIVLLYGAHRFLYVLRRIEAVHEDYLPDHTLIVVPSQLIFVVGFLTLFVFLTTSQHRSASTSANVYPTLDDAVFESNEVSQLLTLLGTAFVDFLPTL